MTSFQGVRITSCVLCALRCCSHQEKLTLNQYWYSAKTIGTMVAEIERVAKRVAFLSTPSVYFSLASDSELRKNSRLFDVRRCRSQPVCASFAAALTYVT